MSRALVWMVIVAATSLHAEAAPNANVIVSGKAQRRLVDFVPSGSHAALLWTDVPAYPQTDAKIRAAVIDTNGKLVAGPTVAFDVVDNDIEDEFIAWNGSSFTVGYCARIDSETRTQHIVWGDLALDGTFNKRGDHTLAKMSGTVRCGPAIAGTPVQLPIATFQDGMIIGPSGPSDSIRVCTHRRLSLDGASAKVGKQSKLCPAMFATREWTLAEDTEGRLVLAMVKGATTRISKVLKGEVSPHAVAADGRALVAYIDGDDHEPYQFARIATPIKKKRAELVKLGSRKAAASKFLVDDPPFASTLDDMEVVPGHGIALVHRVTGSTSNHGPLYGELYTPDGTLAWGDEIAADADGVVCTPGTDAVICAWSDGSSIRARRFEWPSSPSKP